MSKIKSRKFLVWLAWLVITGVSIAITKAVDPTVISWFGTVSIIYIGGNTVQKFIYKDK